MALSNPIIERAQHWLATWQQCIRDCNYTLARTLFDDEVTAFGTVAARMTGIEALVHEQWMKVWEHTREFTFDLQGWTVVLAGENHCVVAIGWTCVAVNRATQREYVRAGRASIVLKEEAGALRCVHTHFSLDPAPEAFAQ